MSLQDGYGQDQGQNQGQGERTGQVIYQADDNAVQAVRGIKQQMHHLGNQYSNRPVRIQTVDGVTYEGRISHLDGDHMFIIVPGHGHHGGHHEWNDGHHGGHYHGYSVPGHQGGHHHGGYPGQWHQGGHHGGHTHPGHQGGGQYPGVGQQGIHPQYRSFYGGSSFNDVILPLVLYNLLVITLL